MAIGPPGAQARRSEHGGRGQRDAYYRRAGGGSLGISLDSREGVAASNGEAASPQLGVLS